jgi:hypothetical protein
VKGPFDFIVSPLGERYNNKKKINDKELILNTNISEHKFVNREAIVKSVPTAFETEIKPGDTIITHHNVFRRWYDMKGRERNSRSFFNENTYLIKEDQIFLYKRKDEWKAPSGYCFVQPIKQRNKLSTDKEESCIGIIKYTDGTYKINDLVGFMPFSTYEFVIDGKRLYRVITKFITIKYEYQGNEEEYNPSWAESC